jgi:hypothetical protein
MIDVLEKFYLAIQQRENSAELLPSHIIINAFVFHNSRIFNYALKLLSLCEQFDKLIQHVAKM